MKIHTVFTIALCSLLATGCAPQRANVAEKVMAVAAEHLLGVDSTASWEDGLHAVVCGAGGPMPDTRRSGSCVIIVAGESTLMIDSGTMGVRNVARMGIPIGKLDAVLLTHFHSDHIDGLGETATLRWVNNANTKPLPVIGPTGVKEIVDGFNMAYRQDTVYRHAHHGDTVAPLSGKGMVARAFAKPAEGRQTVVFNENGLKVTAFSVDHAPVSPAVGYRFDYKGRSLLISGDTDKSANLQRMAKGVDVLLHEGLAPNLVDIMRDTAKRNSLPALEKIFFDILDYHASPKEAGEIAQAVGARHLVFYHVVPPLIAPGAEAAYLRGVKDVYNGKVTVSVDGTKISLPAGSKRIELDDLL